MPLLFAVTLLAAPPAPGNRNPASRALDVNDVFPRALAEKWPCPH